LFSATDILVDALATTGLSIAVNESLSFLHLCPTPALLSILRRLSNRADDLLPVEAPDSLFFLIRIAAVEEEGSVADKGRVAEDGRLAEEGSVAEDGMVEVGDPTANMLGKV
jgi:hypothetical protein